MPHPIVRAIDVGYGEVKFSEGRDPQTKAIRTDSFPSASPAASEQSIDRGVMQRRDTFIVQVGERRFEVGHDIDLALHGNHESDVLDHDFALSDAYMARLLGAMNYMAPGLPDKRIDQLVLGLPLTTYFKHSQALAKRFSGEHAINSRGDRISVMNCVVYPQPAGSYALFLASQAPSIATAQPMALVVDVGYNTVDWFVCRGMKANEIRSNAANLGMSQILRAAADKIIKETGADASATEVARRIDRSLKTGFPFAMYGQHFDYQPFLNAGRNVSEEAAQAIKNKVGAGTDIDVIVMTGGGVALYAQAVRSKFPKHSVILLEEPAFANVRGFHAIGEKLAQSAQRAASLKEPANHA